MPFRSGKSILRVMIVVVVYYRLEEPIMEMLHGAKNGVHAFGYNSAESEPIWMKYGSL